MKRRVPKNTIIPKPNLIFYVTAELDKQIADGKAILHLKKPLLNEYGKFISSQTIPYLDTSGRQIYHYKGHAVVEDNPNEGQAGFTQLMFRGIPVVSNPNVSSGTMYVMQSPPRRHGKLKGLTGV